jgi:hypothetical protein
MGVIYMSLKIIRSSVYVMGKSLKCQRIDGRAANAKIVLTLHLCRCSYINKRGVERVALVLDTCCISRTTTMVSNDIGL